MRISGVRPTGIERSFGADEIIVTKTDLKGRLTYANDVFLRLSAYEEADVLGEPHSIIRHPDMPRGVFKLLWDTLASQHELFAFVCNLAGDGAHYWVLAHVTPSYDASDTVVGYHSNRRVPARRAISEVERLYRLMCTEERRHARAADAASAGLALLQEKLLQDGCTYDEWVWSLAGSELVA